MLDKIYILGAGGIAQEVYQIYKSLGQKESIKGFLISSNFNKKHIESISVLKFSDDLKLEKSTLLINGIGHPLRKQWIVKLENKGFNFASIIHPTVFIGTNLKKGNDLVVFPNCTIISNVSLGNHIFISANVYVGHDAVIEDFVTIGPGVNIGGRTKIGNGSFIGIGSTIIQGVKIGTNVLIGAGSVVVSDIPSNVLAYGNPARPIKKMTQKMWENFL